MSAVICLPAGLFCLARLLTSAVLWSAVTLTAGFTQCGLGRGPHRNTSPTRHLLTHPSLLELLLRELGECAMSLQREVETPNN